MKLLIAGDTHGNNNWIAKLVSEASASGCEAIVQVGDFGYWPHMSDGVKFLDLTEKALSKENLNLYWIDGNHENHEMLRQQAVDPTTGYAEIREHIFYIPRGTRWTWDGVTFLGLGGAYSIDKDRRRQGTSWWPEETITYAEADHATAGGHADVMLTHDCPLGVDPFGPETVGPKNAYPESYANRMLLTAVVDAVRPSLLIHGHYHHRHRSVLHGDDYTTIVEGLGRDGDKASYLVFDTQVFKENQ